MALARDPDEMAALISDTGIESKLAQYDSIMERLQNIGRK
jgi:hypothetical protein